MSRFPRASASGPRLRAAVAALALANVALLVLAVASGGAEVRDGAGSITNGWLVAGGIALTLVLSGLAGLTGLPAGLVARGRALALGGQVLHAGGHLFRWYYDFQYYDDLLHFGLAFLVGLVADELFRTRGFGLSWRLLPLRFGLLVWIAVVAAAGLWEIFEFSVDVALGTREQDDLRDTMLDMIDGTLGGLLAGAWAARGSLLERRAKALGDARSDELLD